MMIDADRLPAGLAAHLAGRLDEARETYRAVLQSSPENAEAWRFLGDIEHRRGRMDAARQALDRALAIDPEFPEALAALGSLLLDLGAPDEARAHLERALAARPDFAEARATLGECLRRLGEPEGARRECEAALADKPDLAQAHNNLGAALMDLDRPAAAATCFRHALEQDADLAVASVNLADALRRCGDLAGATAEAEAAVAGAREALDKALAIDPELADAHGNLGNALLRAGAMDAAIMAYQRALALDQDHADAMVNLGTAFQTQGRWRDALDHYDHVLARHPGHVDGLWNRALALLMKGDYRAGFAAYETRWQLPGRARRRVAAPLWDGGGIAGKTVLVLAEQGYGDMLQMARFLSPLASRAGRVIVECYPPLLPLFAGIRGVAACVAHGAPLPDCDFHVPLMSLAHLLETDLESLPAAVPYLDPPPDRRPPACLARASGFKLGVVWQGRPSPRNFLGRPCPPAALAPLAALPGIELFSLQVGDAIDALRDQPWGERVVDLGTGFGDFGDTAAAIRGLDLVISIDTAVAHLAGALGAPTWTLLSVFSDWRWMRGRDDSPWYPTMRLFRQTSPGDWDGLLGRVAEALVSSRGGSN